MNWNKVQRATTLSSFANEEYDVVIIGGGITGAGVLLDASSRGLKCILIEKDDFASGTSSRSTKLVHGGLRYLKNLEFKIVRETGQERAIAYHNAPHLVIPEKMILPIQKGGTYGKFGTSVGLKVYDWLAGVQKEDRRKMLNKERTLQEEPLLKPDLLKGSGFYSEYRTDDARLTLEVIKTSFEYGGKAVNFVEATAIEYDSNGKISQINCIDLTDNKNYILKGKVFINACGPWSDEIREMDQSMNNKRLHLTKGVHIVFDHSKFPLNHSVYFDVKDGRMIFAIPRGKSTYVGTTDTNYSKEKENPEVTQEDIKYLLDATNVMFPSVKLTSKDVQSSWAGLRPLIHEEGKSPSELSRKDEVFLSPKGLITIAGGKLTGYRLMAKKVVDLTCKRLNKDVDCKTKTIQLNGYATEKFAKQILSRLEKFELQDTEYTSWHLLHTFGKQAITILEILEQKKYTSIIEAEAIFCIENELTLNLLDFFIRRTGRMYFDITSVIANLTIVGTIFANHYNWDNETLALQLEEVNKELKRRNPNL